MSYSYIQSARDLAKELHKNDKRRDGKPYFSHLEAVANYVEFNYYSLIPQTALEHWGPMMDFVISASYLHDSVEHKHITLNELDKKGFNKLIIGIVDIVTRRENEDYFEYIMRIHDSGPFVVGAVAVKLADLAHNLENNTNKKQIEKYKFARYILKSFNN